MSNDDERDPVEERWVREFCPACGTSPCEAPDGNHEDDDEDDLLP